MATFRGCQVDLASGNRGDAEFGRDPINPLPRDIEVDVTVGSKVRADVALIELLWFITPQPIEKRGDAVNGQARLVGKGSEGSPVSPNERQQRWAIEGNINGVYHNAHGGDLEVIADPRQQAETFFLGDLFR